MSHLSRCAAVPLSTVCCLLSALACGSGDKPVTAGTPADTADQVIFGLVHNITLDGVPRAKLEADTAYFYQTPQKADLKHIHVIFYRDDGSIASDLTALAGKYEWRTGNMRAIDSVVATTPDGRKLKTSILDYQRGNNQISGPEYFIFDGPGRHLEGDAFTSDPEFNNVTTKRPKKGTLGTVELKH